MYYVAKILEMFQPIQMFIIINISFFFQLKCKRKFAESIAVSIMTVIMVLYVCTFFMPLSYSANAVLILSLAAFAYNVVHLIKNRQQIKIQSILSIPFLIIILDYIFVNYVFRDYYAIDWDEFSHWMLVVKNMVYFDNFGVTGASTVMLTGYPPAAGLIESFFNLFPSSFNESNAYKGLNMLLIALLLSPLKEYETGIKRMLMAFLIIISVPLIFYSSAYNSVYVDCLLGVMFGRLMYVVFSEEKYDLFFLYNFSISSAVLVLTKSSGKGLYLFCIIALLTDFLFFSRNQIVDGLNIKSKLISSLALSSVLIVPFAAIQSWKLYIKNNNLIVGFDTSAITISRILELFSGNILPYQVATKKAFIDAFFSVREFGDIGVKSSYFLLLIIFVIATACISRMGTNKRRVYCFAAVLSMSYILYATSLLVLYLFLYSEYEATRIASFDRYMNTIVLGCMLAIVIFLLNPVAIHRTAFETDNKGGGISNAKLHVVIMAAVLFLTSVELKNLFIWQANREGHQEQSSHIRALNGIFDYKMDKVYYIAQGSSGYEHRKALFILTPVSIVGWGWSIANEPKEGDIWTVQRTLQQWSDELKANYTYVYLDIIDDQFIAEFGGLFENLENISGQTLYKVEVNEENDLVRLVRY